MRSFITLVALAVLVGCAAPQPLVKINHLLIAPDDVLLVDCDIDPPPSKGQYLQDYAIGVTSAKLAYDEHFHLTQYARALQGAQKREAALTQVMMRNYGHQDACNRRWKKLREWKAAVVKGLDIDKPTGSK